MLSIDELNSYQNWIGKSPQEIRRAVVDHGGWAKVFPRGDAFPLWASRVRNYFNERPMQLMLLGVLERGRAESRTGLTPSSLYHRGAYALLGFSGDVYRDEASRHWFEMSTASTVYHYEGQVSNAMWYKKWEAFVSRQKSTPVFKLISSDGTGGSLEVILHNWQSVGGKSQIGPEGKWVTIRTKVVINEIYRGSYNYSDTGIMGFKDHEFRDVKPHRQEFGFYVNPPRKQSARRFPSDDRKGRKIVESDGYFSGLNGSKDPSMVQAVARSIMTRK